MARHLSVDSVIDKNRISSNVVWTILLAIDIVDPNTRDVTETLRICRNNENISFGTDSQGNPLVYQAANFDIQIEQRQNQAPTVSVTAQDQMRYIQQRMEEMAGGVFSEVTMMVVNCDRLDKPAEIEERFQITNASTKGYVVTFQLGAENPLAIQFPKHVQRQDRCAWRFRDYGCGYAGSATKCSYTKDGPQGCSAKGNTINFRGLPGLVRMNV